MKKLNVGILGATGMVGQRFIEQLQEHPYFEIKALAASDKSAGKKYSEAAKWYLASDIPGGISDMVVQPMEKGIVKKSGLDLVFSAIPAEIAKEVEGSFAGEVPVFSNTKTYRMEDDVPLVIPEVNPEHLDLIKVQREKRGWKGFVVTNPNCSTIGLVIPLKPVYDKLGIKWVNVTTMQAISGAGYSGVPSMAIIDNMVPFIGGEEEKMETETLKLLGKLGKGRVDYADFPMAASCNRVFVKDGHTESVLVGTESDFDVDGVKKIFRNFEGEPQKLKLPSAPDPAIVVMEEDDRPQPRFDRSRGGGMAVSVGRIARKREKVLRFTCLSHNTIRGAAGASVLNAELCYRKKLF